MGSTQIIRRTIRNGLDLKTKNSSSSTVRGLEERKHASQKRHYEKNRETILAKQKTRQQLFRKRVKLVKDVGQFADKARHTIVNARTALNDLKLQAGNNHKFIGSLFKRPQSLESFANLEEPLSVERYPRIISYLLPSSSLPQPVEPDPRSLLLDLLPNQYHFRLASQLTHSDKVDADKSQYFKYLSEGWSLWKPYFEKFAGSPNGEYDGAADGCGGVVEAEEEDIPDSEGVVLDERLRRELSTITVADLCEDEDTFRSKGESYNTLADMYWAYYGAFTASLGLMDYMSPWTLTAVFDELDKAQQVAEALHLDSSLVDGDDMKTLIKEALEDPVKGKTGRRKKRKHGSIAGAA